MSNVSLNSVMASILTVGMLIPLSIAAQEHLEPEHGVFSVWTAAYQERIREVFAEGYRYDVLLKAIILDSSSTESLIALRQSPDGLETVHLAAATDICNHSFLPQPEGSRRRSEIAPIQIKVTRRPIDKHTADDIMTLWKKVLLETRYAEPGRFGKDGVIYMFSMKDPYRGILSGQIWSSEAKSRMEHFTHLAESLVRYTHQSLTQTELDQVVNNTRHFLAP
jgi:hypothetical protein